MDTKFAKITFEVRCDWEGFSPEYRVYLNDEMLTERTFIWNSNTHIKEIMQIQAEPGIYEFRLEELEPKNGTFTTSNIDVKVGNVKIINENTFEIL